MLEKISIHGMIRVFIHVALAQNDSMIIRGTILSFFPLIGAGAVAVLSEKKRNSMCEFQAIAMTHLWL